jgi:mRNA interferase MazF
MMRQKQRYKRGDIILVAFPNSNLQSAKQRPALVVQADGLNTGLAQIIVAMITSNMTRSNHPSRITILLDSPEAKLAGLLTDSVVMTDNLATVMEQAVTRIVGSMPMSQIDAALRHTLGLAAQG